MSVPTKIRCKFQVVEIAETMWPAKKVKLSAVYRDGPGASPEDIAFTKATPSGALEVMVENPAAMAMLTMGREFYLDLVPADPIAVANAESGA